LAEQLSAEDVLLDHPDSILVSRDSHCYGLLTYEHDQLDACHNNCLAYSRVGAEEKQDHQSGQLRGGIEESC